MDYYFYRNDKMNRNMYIVDRLLVLIGLNSAGFVENSISMIGILGGTLGIVFMLKVYYVVVGYFEYREIRRK